MADPELVKALRRVLDAELDTAHHGGMIPTLGIKKDPAALATRLAEVVRDFILTAMEEFLKERDEAVERAIADRRELADRTAELSEARLELERVRITLEELEKGEEVDIDRPRRRR